MSIFTLQNVAKNARILSMNHAIILAAGSGTRLKSTTDKMLLEAGGRPLIYHSIMAFNDHPDIGTITVVISKNNKSEIESLIKDCHFPKVVKIVLGGRTRQESFEKGFAALSALKADKNDIILVHNGANPLPSEEEITRSISEAQEVGACIVGHFLDSTIKEIDGKRIVKTHDRDKFFAAQTPQTARHNIFKKALDNAAKKKLEATDEAMLLEAIGQEISYIEAHENNFKITTQADLKKLQAILGDLPEDFRVGIGQDSHVFEERVRGLIFGGLTLKDELKLSANSDGDVILHAIFNALSQAMGDMSLGFYADELCEKGIKDSKKYLEPLLKKIKKDGFAINSLGLMLECKTPKIDPLVPQLKKSLSAILGLPPQRIGITATGGEELTTFGQGIGIQCFAIVSLVKGK